MVEVPPSARSIGGITVPVTGHGYVRLSPQFVIAWTMRLLNCVKGIPSVIYLHPREIDPERPRISSLSGLTRFRHYVNLSRMAEKLKRFFETAAFGSMRQIVERATSLPTGRIG